MFFPPLVMLLSLIFLITIPQLSHNSLIAQFSARVTRQTLEVWAYTAYAQRSHVQLELIMRPVNKYKANGNWVRDELPDGDAGGR